MFVSVSVSVRLPLFINLLPLCRVHVFKHMMVGLCYAYTCFICMIISTQIVEFMKHLSTISEPGIDFRFY